LAGVQPAELFSLLYQGLCVIGPTSVHVKWHLNSSNGLNMVQECDRQQTDGTHCGGVLAVHEVILPNN